MTKEPELPISVWIVEDNDRLREYLTRYLNEPNDFVCHGSFSNCEDALEALGKSAPPKVLLIDLGLPGMHGAHGISEFKRQVPEVEALVLTVNNDREQVFEAISAGASGYLLKSASFREITEACRKVASGESSLDGGIARMMLGAFQKAKPKSAEHNLTKRELQILECLAEGLYCKEIASDLKISESTVNFHCSNLYKKLHVQSQRGAIKEAKKRGIL